MPITIEKKDLLPVLNFVSHGLGKQGFIEGADRIVFDGTEGQVWAFDGDVGAVVGVAEPLTELSGAVEGQKLVSFVSKAPGGKIRLRLKDEDKQLEVRSATASVSIAWGGEVPNLPYPMPEKWLSVAFDGVPKDEEDDARGRLAEGLRLAAACCASHLTRPLLTCVRLTANYITATDSMRAIRYRFPFPLKGAKMLSALIPRNAAITIAGLQSADLAVDGDRCAWFRNQNGMLFCATMSGDFPDVADHLRPAEKGVVKFALPLPKLDPVLDRAKMFSAEDAIEGERYVDMHTEDGRLVVEAQDDRSSFRESIEVDSKLPEFSATLNIQHLLDLVGQKQEIECTLSQELGRLWIETERWQYVSLVRVKGEKK